MNGRCETDPFDRAVDVCRICYGEFCWSCVVEAKGHKQPMCRECALIVGGLRPKAKPRIRGSKKTAKARRDALREAREAPRHHGASFTFFDAKDDSGFAEFQEAEPALAPKPPQLMPEVQAPPDVEDSPAVQRLDSIRRADREGASGADQFALDAPLSPAADSPPFQSTASTPAGADTDQFVPEPFASESLGQDPFASGSTNESTKAVSPSEEALDEEASVGYEPPPWESLAAPSDLAQMETSPTEDHNTDFDEPAEFRKPRPFVAAAAKPSVKDEPVKAAAAQALPQDNSGQADPASSVSPTAPEASPKPIDGQPSASPPPEFAVASAARAELDEPVHIHDDPWARTGPEVVSTAPLPRRRPDPKPSEDSSTSPPDWTKAKLPKFD